MKREVTKNNKNRRKVLMAMKKIIAAALAVTLLGSTLAGCSSGDKNTGGTDSSGVKTEAGSENQGSENKTAGSGEREKLEFWGWWGSEARKPVLEEAVKMFNESQDKYEVTYVNLPWGDVLTNSVSHIDELIYYKIPCIMVGGSIKAATNSCIGLIAENILKGFNFNKCFIGANGFSITSGITNHDINENVIKTLAVRQSCNPYFLMDSSKFNVVAMVKLANISDYPIITEKIIPELSSYPNIIYSNN